MRIVGLLIVLGIGLSACASVDLDENARPRIAVIPKGTTHVFWQMVAEGARLAGQDFDVDIIWKGPLKENDRAMQIQLVQQFVSEQVDGIVLAPLDESALVRPVAAAAQQGIPVVIFDSAIKANSGTEFVSFVATDNRLGGELAGREMIRLLQGKGKVVLLRYQVGSASTTNREEGFLAALEGSPDIQVIAENQYAGATAGEAIQKSEEMLDLLREADGIFAPNESATYGVLVTLRKHRLAGDIRFIGFDASRELVDALEKDQIDALVLQNPRHMAYTAVETMVKHLNGEAVPARVDTGVKLVTQENLDDPEIARLLP